jgi:hypothetical protein
VVIVENTMYDGLIWTMVSIVFSLIFLIEPHYRFVVYIVLFRYHNKQFVKIRFFN